MEVTGTKVTGGTCSFCGGGYSTAGVMIHAPGCPALVTPQPTTIKGGEIEFTYAFRELLKRVIKEALEEYDREKTRARGER
jgi:hypothetical protein